MECESPSATALQSSQVGASDDARIREILTTHFRFIYRFLRRLGVHESEVDDACQHVFMIVHEHLEHIERGKEKAYLFSTASRVAANARRAQRNRPIPCADETSNAPTLEATSDPEELLEHKQGRQLLDAALEELPLELRTIFVLYELEELSSPEIAELTGLPLGTVASRLRRARASFEQTAERLRQQLSHQGGAP